MTWYCLRTAVEKPSPFLGSLAPDPVEEPETAVITQAMLEEEEQLEAAGLERERKMIEKVLEDSSSPSLKPVVGFLGGPVGSPVDFFQTL